MSASNQSIRLIDAPSGLASFSLGALLFVLIAGSAEAQQIGILDDFSNPASWEPVASEGIALKVAPDDGFSGRSIRLDIDYQEHGGYVIVRRAVDLTLPENYEFTFRIRGDLPRNNLEFKLVDGSDDNVWWLNQRNFEFTEDWRLVRIRKRHITFAWGPQGGGDPGTIAAIEFAISVGTGGRGSVWIDELTFGEREPERPYDLTPTANASVNSASARAILDSDPATAWQTSARTAVVSLDFLREREYGGAVILWGSRWATDYDVETSDDGRTWSVLREVRGSNGGRDYLFLPEALSRHLRLRLRESSGGGFEIRELEVQPLSFGDSKTELFHRIAADSPRGSFPKYFDRVQSYWTVAGAPADEEEILINEEGMIEVGGVGGFSIEPFLTIGESKLITWTDVEKTQSLAGGRLPIPSVQWLHPTVGLEITALAGGPAGNSAARAIYQLTNRGNAPLDATLHVAIRPFQVNPPWQFLNVIGGFSEIRSIGWDGVTATVNGRTTLTPSPAPDSFGASTFDSGSIVEHLRDGKLPTAGEITDPFRAASAALSWNVSLNPGGRREISIDVPLHPEAPPAPPLAAVRAQWEAALDEVEIGLPPAAEAIQRTLESNLAYILVNQDEASIQPGSRAYDRSWIRDGSLTSAALLRFGHTAAVRRFIEWYVGFQGEDGRVPCCVGKRGGDPVPEHDSHGQLIYVIAEYVRQTGDLAFARSMWPHVVSATKYIDELRHERMTPEYQTPEKLPYYGLMPESISHEGYSAKAMHSYWDQLFGLKGLKDATWLAGQLVAETCAGWTATTEVASPAAECGALERERARIATLRDAFRDDLRDSFARAMAMHGIDYLPGSVELGDFDATSTTIALEPVDAVGVFPPGALERTFEKYWQNFVARRDGTLEWDAYTPYEHRVVGSFIRLGWIDRAHEALAWFMEDRRPAAWNHWAEVVWNDPATPKFIGDMPHTWVGSDFIRSLVDFFAFERESDHSLVIGAGIPLDWAREGVRIRGLRTWYGPLSYSIQPAGNAIRFTIDPGLKIPRGGIRVELPFSPPRQIHELPADFTILPEEHRDSVVPK